MRVWLDTDIGSDVDDALALAYVVRHPDLELVGLSTVFGDLAVRTAIARRLLAMAGAEDVPVVAGLEVPLTPGKRGIMFGHEGLGMLDEPSPRLRVADETGGETRVGELMAAVDDAAPDVIVAIGPLTNVAAMVRAGATLAPLAIMGGKLSDDMLPGMVPEIPEWNWFCDPEAVQTVLAAEHEQPPIVVPAEITFQTRLATGDVDALAEGDALTATLATLCGHWLELQRSAFDRPEPRVALHDPLTAGVLVEPNLCTFAPREIAVDDRGATTLVGTGTGTVTAAVGVDPEAVRRHLMDWLLPPHRLGSISGGV
jgi:purine nucleosidase